MIDPKLEATFRELVGHAIHDRENEIVRIIATAGQEAYGKILTLTIEASAYTVLYAAERWPNDADLKETSRIAAAAKSGLEISADDIYAFLKDVVFGSGPAGFHGHPMTPLGTLGRLLVSFKPPTGDSWNDFLDTIETGIEAADTTRQEAAPSITYRFLKK